MAEKKIHVVETYPDGLKAVKSYLTEINAKYSVFPTPPDAKDVTSPPDLVILLAHKDTESCNADIAWYKDDHSFSPIPLLLVIPPRASENLRAIRSDKCQCTFSLPVDKLRFLARVAEFLGIPPRRVFQTVITIMEERGNIRYSGLSVDFSESGMAFESDAEFTPGRKIIVRFINPRNREKFLLDAQIMRRSRLEGKEGFFYGVRFTEMALETSSSLRNFIAGEGGARHTPADSRRRIP